MSLEPFVFVLLGIVIGRLLSPPRRSGPSITLYQPGDLVRLRGGW